MDPTSIPGYQCPPCRFPVKCARANDVNGSGRRFLSNDAVAAQMSALACVVMVVVLFMCESGLPTGKHQWSTMKSGSS